MSSMYQLKEQYMELLEMMQEGDVDEQVIKDTLEGIEGEIEDKADNYARIISQLKSDVEGLKKEINRLSTRKKAIENHIQSLRGNLKDAMETTGKTKFKTDFFSFNIKPSAGSVVIDDPTSIPEEFLIPQEPKVDTKSINDFLKKQEDNRAGFAHLEKQWSLVIL